MILYLCESCCCCYRPASAHTRLRLPLMARLMEQTWGPSGTDGTQLGLMLAPWTLLSGLNQWMGSLNQFTPFSYFSRFSTLVKTIAIYLIPRSYFTGVAAAQLRWHQSYIKMIQRIWRVFEQNKIILDGEINERGFSDFHPTYSPKW